MTHPHTAATRSRRAILTGEAARPAPAAALRGTSPHAPLRSPRRAWGPILALAICAAPALADPRHEWPGTAASGFRPAWVEIHEPTEPGAVAAVTFRNEPVHEAGEDFAVTREGLTVRIEMEWQVDGGQEERLTLHPPEGYVAVPRTLTVPESAAATAQIYAFGPNS